MNSCSDIMLIDSDFAFSNLAGPILSPAIRKSTFDVTEEVSRLELNIKVQRIVRLLVRRQHQHLLLLRLS